MEISILPFLLMFISLCLQDAISIIGKVIFHCGCDFCNPADHCDQESFLIKAICSCMTTVFTSLWSRGFSYECWPSVSVLGRCWFKSDGYLKFAFICKVYRSFYASDDRFFLSVWFANLFSHSMGFPFHFR